MAHGRSGGNTRKRRAAKNSGFELRRDEQTRAFDVRTVLSLVAETHAVPSWMTAAGGEAPAGVWPLVREVELWLERTESHLIDAVQPHALDELARVVSRAVRVTVAVPAASDGDGEHLLVTHQVYCPMTGARWTARFHAAVELSTIEEYNHLLGQENSRVRQIQAVFPDVWIFPHHLAAVVSADSRAKVDMAARELRAALSAVRRQALLEETRVASDFVAHAREHQLEEWHELRQALLEADAEWRGAY